MLLTYHLSRIMRFLISAYDWLALRFCSAFNYSEFLSHCKKILLIIIGLVVLTILALTGVLQESISELFIR
ncbi:hypothetical protein QE439_000795 [Pedobacter agri]|nr:hypothetical protein [Pedobacter agri]